jgi:ribosome-binding protein aMBF1 (putative translation factor)
MSATRRNDAEARFDASVGLRIARARKVQRIAAVDLAWRLGISTSGLYRVEAGGRCSFFLACEIAAALGLGLADLVPDKTHLSTKFSSGEKNPRFVRGPAFHRLG